MKRLIFLILLIISSSDNTQAQNSEDISKELKILQLDVINIKNQDSKQRLEIGVLSNQLKQADIIIDSLRTELSKTQTDLNQTKTALGLKIATTESNAEEKFAAVDSSVSTRTLYGIIIVLIALIGTFGLFWMMRKKQQSDKDELAMQISSTSNSLMSQLKDAKNSIDVSLISELNKYSELVTLQLNSPKEQKSGSLEPDHSLALKVASEINLIERNISLMDAKTKGLKQLQASVGKLKDNLLANGYDMPQLAGKPFHQGMKVIVASSIPDESLEKGAEIISKVLIPQVNYNDKMIQTAQIEVSVGY